MNKMILITIMFSALLLFSKNGSIKKEDISFVYKINLDKKITTENIILFDSTCIYVKDTKIDYEKLIIPVLKELRKKSKELYILKNPEMFK